MSKEIKIRKGKIADTQQVLKLWKELTDYHRKFSKIDMEMINEAPEFFMKYYSSHVRSGNKIAIVAEDNGTIVGYLLGTIQKRPPVMKTTHLAFISDMAVTTKFRKKGIGKKIINEFVIWAKEKQMKYITLQVAQENDIGVKFWKSAGFETAMFIQRKLL